jgi:uncharacterized protein (DUF1810 family)
MRMATIRGQRDRHLIPAILAAARNPAILPAARLALAQPAPAQQGGDVIPPQDPLDLERFVTAQAPVFDRALAELQAGRKRSHWMWFIFPQLRGLGFSTTARLYGIASLAEARAYLIHPLLGPRLETCMHSVLALQNKSLQEIFGSPDDMKFCSCITLFSLAADSSDSPFQIALDRYCGGRQDERTMELLDGEITGANEPDHTAD